MWKEFPADRRRHGRKTAEEKGETGMKQVIGIAGHESGYWRRLMEYLNEKDMFEAFVCTREECLGEELERRKPSHLFREKGFAGNVHFDGEEVLFLPDRKEAGQQGIYQYQPAEQICQEMIGYLRLDGSGFSESGGEGKLYGVYSPLGRSGKTSFALSYAKSHSFFYLGMEDYGLIGKSKSSMDDVIYLIKNRKKDICMEMSALSEVWREIRMIRSPIFFQDVLRLSLEDWMWFLGCLKEGGFSAIADFGTAGLIDFGILALFDRVYVTELEGEIEQKKLSLFRERFLESCGSNDGRMRMIRVPRDAWESSTFLERVEERKM